MKSPIVIIHGWNGKPERWEKAKRLLEEKGFKVFIPQLPGFVKDTQTPWLLNDYAEWVIKFINRKQLEKAVLICHSNGGRIGMKLAAIYPDRVAKLFLINSAGIRTMPQWKRQFFRHIAKIGKTILGIFPFSSISGHTKKFLYKILREHDYETASPILRKTLVNILEEDLSSEFSNIKIPTTLIWGVNDRLTPPTSAVKLHQAIPNSKLLWVGEAGHALPFTHTEKMIDLISDELSVY